jgi:hypothetical protein
MAQPALESAFRLEFSGHMDRGDRQGGLQTRIIIINVRAQDKPGGGGWRLVQKERPKLGAFLTNR